MIEETSLNIKDALIYIALKSHWNKTTGQCNPGFEILQKETSASINTIKKCINNLIEAGFITRTKCGRGYNYSFVPYKQFEPFTYEFLYHPEYTFREKAILACEQQYMYIDSSNIGKINYSSLELAKLLGISLNTLYRTEKSLQNKKALTIVETNSKDMITGCKKSERIFSLEKFGQGVVYALKNHEERIQENEQDIETLKKNQEILINEVRRLKDKYEKPEEMIL